MATVQTPTRKVDRYGFVVDKYVFCGCFAPPFSVPL